MQPFGQGNHQTGAVYKVAVSAFTSLKATFQKVLSSLKHYSIKILSTMFYPVIYVYGLWHQKKPQVVPSINGSINPVSVKIAPHTLAEHTPLPKTSSLETVSKKPPMEAKKISYDAVDIGSIAENLKDIMVRDVKANDRKEIENLVVNIVPGEDFTAFMKTLQDIFEGVTCKLDRIEDQKRKTGGMGKVLVAAYGLKYILLPILKAHLIKQFKDCYGEGVIKGKEEKVKERNIVAQNILTSQINPEHFLHDEKKNVLSIQDLEQTVGASITLQKSLGSIQTDENLLVEETFIEPLRDNYKNDKQKRALICNKLSSINIFSMQIAAPNFLLRLQTQYIFLKKQKITWEEDLRDFLGIRNRDLLKETFREYLLYSLPIHAYFIKSKQDKQKIVQTLLQLEKNKDHFMWSSSDRETPEEKKMLFSRLVGLDVNS